MKRLNSLDLTQHNSDLLHSLWLVLYDNLPLGDLPASLPEDLMAKLRELRSIIHHGHRHRKIGQGCSCSFCKRKGKRKRK